jgi:hypothetical protein
MPSTKVDVHVRRTIVRGELLKTAVNLPQLLSNVDIFGAQFAELAKLSTDRHLHHVAEWLAPITASGTPQEPARRTQRVVEALTMRGVDTSLGTGAEDRCGVCASSGGRTDICQPWGSSVTQTATAPPTHELAPLEHAPLPATEYEYHCATTEFVSIPRAMCPIREMVRVVRET